MVEYDLWFVYCFCLLLLLVACDLRFSCFVCGVLWFGVLSGFVFNSVWFDFTCC